MHYLENPFKKIVVAGAIAMNAAACAAGAGEKAEAMNPQDAMAEQSANSPEVVRKKLLDSMKLGLNENSDGTGVLVAIGEGLSIDMAEDVANQALQSMKIEYDDYVFLPSSGTPKVEKASDGHFYVRVSLKGAKK